MASFMHEVGAQKGSEGPAAVLKAGEVWRWQAEEEGMGFLYS